MTKNESIIVIGDVHGHFDTLMELVKQFPPDLRISFVGDLIDRGPKSREVIQFVIDNNHDCVLGNHEQMAINSKMSWDGFQDWNRNGGFQARASYPEGEMSIEHFEYLKTLPIFRLYENCVSNEGRALLVSHTGFRRPYDKIIPSVHKEESIWNRNKPLRQEAAYQVIGHTPVRQPLIESYYANIDTGVYLSDVGRKEKGYGCLTALQFPEMIVYSQERLEK